MILMSAGFELLSSEYKYKALDHHTKTFALFNPSVILKNNVTRLLDYFSSFGHLYQWKFAQN